MKYKLFKEILAKNAQSTLDRQKQILSASFEDWKGAVEQVDDVCILGFRL